MEKIFGTDGIRGIPGKPPLTKSEVQRIASIAARLFLSQSELSKRNGTHSPILFLGRDTRFSGPELTRALASGFALEGIRTLDLGVVPTPAISYLASQHSCLGGVVVSASHNPARFNGIKFFDRSGKKIDAVSESAIENEFAKPFLKISHPFPKGNIENRSDLSVSYLDFLRSTFPATADLSDLKIVLDCANGAASSLAPKLFKLLGADVTTLHCSPNGKNINDHCGSLYPESLSRAVLHHKAHCGISFDGDADRTMLVDEKGAVLDGDVLIGIAALNLKNSGLLRSNKVVLTIMSNFALIQFLEKNGISARIVSVGDRQVSEALDQEHLSLGGEPSGHIIFRNFTPTGDGLLTAIQTLAAIKKEGKPLSAAKNLFTPLPQLIENVASEEKIPLEDLPEFHSMLRHYEKELSGRGRLVVRYSGTEPLLRIMLEGPQLARLKSMGHQLSLCYTKETTRSLK